MFSNRMFSLLTQYIIILIKVNSDNGRSNSYANASVNLKTKLKKKSDKNRTGLKLAVRETSVSRHDGVKLRVPLKPLNRIVLWWSGGFQGALNLVPMMPRDASLSDSYTSDCCWFSSLGNWLMYQGRCSIIYRRRAWLKTLTELILKKKN